MNYLFILVTIIFVLVLIIFILARREAGHYGTSAKEEFIGICKSAIETASQKEARKQKAFALLQEKPGLSNAEIRKALGVSSRTAVRYMDELEREGKAEQVGNTGRSVQYRLKR